MSSLPLPTPSRTGRRAAAVAAAALVGGIALLVPATGASASTPGSTPPGSTPPAAAPPRVNTLRVVPDKDLADGEEVFIRADAEIGAVGDIAYSYYLQICSGEDRAPGSPSCQPVGGTLWPASNGIDAFVNLPAVVKGDNGKPVDCRLVTTCSVVAFPYRSSTYTFSPVSFTPPTAHAESETPPSTKPGTKSTAKPAKPVKSKPKYTG